MSLRTRIQTLAVLALAVAAPQPAAAARPVDIVLGYKAWYQAWTLGIGDTTLSQSDFAAVNGPAAVVRWGDVFAGASYLNGKLAEVSGNLGDVGGPIDPTQRHATFRVDVHFSETDVGIGYYFASWIAPYVGLKLQSFEITTRLPTVVQLGTQNLTIPMYGLLLNQQLPSYRWSVFGNVALLGPSGDADGWFIESGTSYGFATVPGSFYVGLRAQQVNFNVETRSIVVTGETPKFERFLGLVAGLSYTF